MTICEIDPISDPRWSEFLQRTPKASVFHTPSWLRAIRDAYGYESLALTTAAPGELLQSGVVFCRVQSWLTGSRLVSVSFADHCEPLVESHAELAAYLRALESGLRERKWKYVEVRPRESIGDLPGMPLQFGMSASYRFHTLDLRPDAETLYRGFHKSCIQRKLQRARREKLTIEHGRSEGLLDKLRHLLLLSRRRHHAPLQPLVWFQSLVRHFGDDLEIWVVSTEERPIAGMLTLAWRDTVVYKYGGSDAQYHPLGGMPALFWEVIRYAKARNATVLDLGRSDLDNPGLIAFKEHWGSNSSLLTYYRYTRQAALRGAQPARDRLASRVLTYLPDVCLTAAGRLLYRHMG